MTGTEAEGLAARLAVSETRRQTAEKQLRRLRARAGRAAQGKSRAERLWAKLGPEGLQEARKRGGATRGAQKAAEAALRRAVCEVHRPDLWFPFELYAKLKGEATRLQRPVATLIVEIVADWFAVRRQWEMSHSWAKPWDESKAPPAVAGADPTKPVPFPMREWRKAARKAGEREP